MKLRDMKIAVTGAEGFIGSHLVERLISEGTNVRALVQYNSFNSFGWLEEISTSESLEIVMGDVRDAGFCNSFLEGIDVCFHLAALIAIPYSYNAPQSYIDVNIHGTNNICRSALQNDLKLLIHTSTSEVYGTAKYVPIDENHILQPQSPYSASKIGADSIAASYSNSFDLPLVIIRPFNTYGPRQSNRAVIPTIISQLLKNDGQINLGDLTPTRDFNYIEDTVDGFIKAFDSHESILGETINLGSGDEISIDNLVKLIAKILDIEAQVISEENRLRPKDSEVFRLLSDISKARKCLDYKPNHSLEDGLRKTIEWFSNKENLRKYKTDQYVI